MTRLLFIAVLLAPATAFAQSLSPSLSRLRVQDDAALCPAGSTRYCADDAALATLANELGGVVGPGVLPAHTRGPRAFYVGLESAMTTITSESPAWRLGTRGDGTGENANVPSMLTHLRLNVRKGLPLGFEVGGSLGSVLRTGMVSLAGRVRWSVFEGFDRGGFRYVPDVSLVAGVTVLAGSPALRLTIPSMMLVLSKRFVVARLLELTPIAGVSLMWVLAHPSETDLTPERDAFAECAPDVMGACTGSSEDLGNNARFTAPTARRGRLVLGLALRYQVFAARASVQVDARSKTPRQWTWRLELGLAY